MCMLFAIFEICLFGRLKVNVVCLARRSLKAECGKRLLPVAPSQTSKQSKSEWCMYNR